MNDVYVDPEQLEAFARVLKGFSKFTEDELTGLNSQLGRLQQSWRDSEFEQFAAHVRRMQGRLQAFTTETAKTIPTLERDAEVMKAYKKLHLEV